MDLVLKWNWHVLKAHTDSPRSECFVIGKVEGKILNNCGTIFVVLLTLLRIKENLRSKSTKGSGAEW